MACPRHRRRPRRAERVTVAGSLAHDVKPETAVHDLDLVEVLGGVDDLQDALDIAVRQLSAHFEVLFLAEVAGALFDFLDAAGDPAPRAADGLRPSSAAIRAAAALISGRYCLSFSIGKVAVGAITARPATVCPVPT